MTSDLLETVVAAARRAADERERLVPAARLDRVTAARMRAA